MMQHGVGGSYILSTPLEWPTFSYHKMAEIALNSQGLELENHIKPELLTEDDCCHNSYPYGDSSNAERDFGWSATTRPEEFIPAVLDKLCFELKNPGKFAA